MNKELLKELHKKLDKPRPRPLMCIGWHNGKKCYVRKKDLTYWQLREKYPPKPRWENIGKARHILAPQHHLTPRRLQHKTGSYVVWGCIIGFAVLSAVLYLAGFFRSLL